MQEMPYDYAPEGADWKKRFEITIPVLLLILVIVVVAWKLGWLASLPFFGGLFGSPSTNILIIGNDQTLVNTLETQVKGDAPINIFTLSKADLKGIQDASYYSKYNLIILTEGSSGDTKSLSSLTLDQIKSFVDSGKPAIVIGLAGSRVDGSPGESGWLKLGFIPVTCQGLKIVCDETDLSYDQLSMYIKNLNHPILKDFTPMQLNFSTGTIKYTGVNPENGVSLLDMEIKIGSATTYSGAALIERTGAGFGGKALYFTFHPSLYAPLLKNAVNYLR